jgi:putative ABC transport system ATP-binding protein
MTGAAVEMMGVSRSFRDGGGQVNALRDVTLRISRGEWVSVTGPSGSGKSTLLNIMGCIDRPTAGRYVLNGVDVSSLSDEDSSSVRNTTVGFVFQSFHLLPRLSILENVLVPVRFSGRPYESFMERADDLIRRMGLTEQSHRLPGQLSGGQVQRAAIARALIMRPTLLLADEPTGNLDSSSASSVLSVLRGLNDEGQTVVVVTHDESIARQASRRILLKDGWVNEAGS